MRQFEICKQIRRRRSLIPAQALERHRAPTLGFGALNVHTTLKGFAARGTLSGLTAVFIHSIPGLSLRFNPGLELANAFGVFVQISNFSI
jgi:hypothetical protein